jgi:hypothetical protein
MFTQIGTARQIHLPIDNTWFSQFVHLFAARFAAEVANRTKYRRDRGKDIPKPPS